MLKPCCISIVPKHIVYIVLHEPRHVISLPLKCCCPRFASQADPRAFADARIGRTCVSVQHRSCSAAECTGTALAHTIPYVRTITTTKLYHVPKANNRVCTRVLHVCHIFSTTPSRARPHGPRANRAGDADLPPVGNLSKSERLELPLWDLPGRCFFGCASRTRPVWHDENTPRPTAVI